MPETTTPTPAGYINGSDLLISVGSSTSKAAIGHSTTHTTTFSSETKDRAVKPAASVTTATAALFKEKSVTGLSVQIKASGLRCYDEDECSYEALLGYWKAAQPIDVDAFKRGDDSSPYLSGKFIITNLEEDAPAGDDTTYSITLDNSGEVDLDLD